jgi:hypothetical protein
MTTLQTAKRIGSRWAPLAEAMEDVGELLAHKAAPILDVIVRIWIGAGRAAEPDTRRRSGLLACCAFVKLPARQ